MLEDKTKEFHHKTIEIVKDKSKDYQQKISALENLKELSAADIPTDSEQYLHLISVISEACGDLHMQHRKIPQAEKSYMDMMHAAAKVYSGDKDKFRSRYGFCCYKRASFYRTCLGCTKPSNPPKVLNESQQKVFSMAETFYKTAIGATFQPDKPMPIADADLHSLCMSELMIMHAAVGNFNSAVKYGSDGIGVERAIYAKLPDKIHGFRLANRLNSLSTIYILLKNPALAAQTMEQSVEIIIKHKEEDPLTFEVLLARTYLSLAEYYSQLADKASLAESTYKNGLKLMTAANEKSDNKLINDVLTAYIMVGDYYIRCKKYAPAIDHYRWAYDMASALLKSTKEPRYELILKKLKPFVNPD